MSKGRDFFGSSMWSTLHCVAVTYTPDKAKAFVSLLWAYVELLPCAECRVNLKKKLEKIPPDAYLRNNHDLFFYTYALHDLVNQDVSRHHGKKKKKSPPYLEIKQRYFSALGEQCKECG